MKTINIESFFLFMKATFDYLLLKLNSHSSLQLGDILEKVAIEYI